MPLVTAFNLRRETHCGESRRPCDARWPASPDSGIQEDDVDVVPLWEPDAFRGVVARINVDLWEGPSRTKDALQELATRVAGAFQGVVGQDRRVKVVIRPYDVQKNGWVSF